MFVVYLQMSEAELTGCDRRSILWSIAGSEEVCLGLRGCWAECLVRMEKLLSHIGFSFRHLNAFHGNVMADLELHSPPVFWPVFSRSTPQ